MVEKEEMMIKLSESRLKNKKSKLNNLEKQREVFFLLFFERLFFRKWMS